MMTTILLIEDEDALREEVADMLRFEGYHVIEAANGRSGIEQAQAHTPALIICDIMMPEIDGYTVLGEVRQNLPGVPFIFLTARAARQDLRQGMNLGADDYVTKPFTHEELLETIQARFRRQQELAEVTSADLERAKSRLARMVAHELRTPLASIKLINDLISRQLGHLSPEMIEEVMQDLAVGSTRLSHLVEQMVLITQLEARHLDHGAIRQHGIEMPLWSLLTGAVNLGRQFAQQHGDKPITVQNCEACGLVLCDPAALKHAFAELIANALIFSPTDQVIIVKNWRKDNLIYISITDHGPGMTPEQLTLALKPYEQIDREHREQQGMGLGLPLAARIIAVHGGALRVRSKPSSGTQVIIRFPFYRSDNP